ncbi:MAG: maleylpyruvate isomerase family mycothiol-dependent enzyme [Acidimicrobiales bacterium]
MALSVERCVSVIDGNGEALAALAAGHFEEEITACPGWRVRSVLQHLIEVHWFWSRVVEARLAAPPAEGRPDPVEDDHLVSRFLLGVHHLTGVLGAADQSAEVYTWASAQHDVAFVTRHQVQEIAVHGADVARAVGAPWSIDTDVAVDAIEEFLTFSVSSRADPADPPRPALDGVLGLRCTDADASWTVEDDVAPGTIRSGAGLRDDAVVIEATAADLLLWLYRRVHLGGEANHAALVARFRHLTFTD